MYVCLCTGGTTRTVEDAIALGAKSTKDVAALCGAGSVCGRCRLTVRRMLAASGQSPARPVERTRRRWSRNS